jgi:hypothetical protein
LVHSRNNVIEIILVLRNEFDFYSPAFDLKCPFFAVIAEVRGRTDADFVQLADHRICRVLKPLSPIDVERSAAGSTSRYNHIPPRMGLP